MRFNRECIFVWIWYSVGYFVAILLCEAVVWVGTHLLVIWRKP